MAVRRAPSPAPVSLDDIILETLVFLRHEVQSLAVTVKEDLAGGAVQVLVDRIQLQQVIVNLLVNAMQAAAQAGGRERRITIRTAVVDNGAVRCTVEDNGPGIEKESFERLFESFFTTKKDGMGIGLSVCRSIVESYGGRIAADNDSADGGARFHFVLPAAGSTTS
jgi:C4-dicarboxylate-specific signal transduction histidine kinase